MAAAQRPARHVHSGLDAVAGDDRRRHRVLRQGASISVLRHRLITVVVGYGLLVVRRWYFWPILRREFFPEVDAGAFEMYVRAPSGTAHRGDRKANQGGRGFRHARRSTRKTCSSFFREIGVDVGLVGRLHPQRRADGRRGQDPVDRGAVEVGPGVCRIFSERRSDTTPVQRPGVCFRRRRHGPLGA